MPKSFKAVDRLKKKTKKELNKKIVRKAQEEVLQALREDKNLDHQVDILHTLIRQDENETKRLAKAEALRVKLAKEEKDRQEKLGVVRKSVVVGRFKYKMKKTDF